MISGRALFGSRSVLPDGPHRRARLLVAVAVYAYSVAVFNRSSLSVTTVAAHHHLHASAEALSLLGVVQLGVYAGLQTPVGLLLHRCRPMSLVRAGALLMLVGQIAMAVAHGLLLALASRILVGAGDALTFLSVLQLISTEAPNRLVPTLYQLASVLGQLGQLAATYPFVLVLARLGWARSFGLAAVVSLSAALVVQLGARFRGRVAAPAGHAVVTGMRATLSSPATKLGVAITFTAQFPGQMFVLFWGYPFLVSDEGVGSSTAGLMLGSYVVFSMISGLIVAAVLTRSTCRRLRLAITLIATTILTWAAVLAWPQRSPDLVLWLLMWSLSFSGPAAVIGLDLARGTSHRGTSGLAIGFVNTAGFVSTVLAILFVGLVIGSSPLAEVGRQSGQFRIAMCTQFVLWAAGIGGILLARRHLAARHQPAAVTS